MEGRRIATVLCCAAVAALRLRRAGTMLTPPRLCLAATMCPPPHQFSVLGVGCAGAAVLLYEGIRVSEVVLRPLPRWASAPLGGALCGLIAFKFPQVCVACRISS
jgi:H+/Cl- antiporter ClcA